MKLLVYTQKVDKEDTILGFFHDWILKLSEKFETVQVICLEKGNYDFPSNVKVYSLGKENKVSKFKYLINFFSILKNVSDSYDRVFVHMNQEYVLLGGLYWKIKNIPVYLWRNHPNGSILTYLAVVLSRKIFCTSTKSFTANFGKTIIMPAGINTDNFKIKDSFLRKKYSICMVGRVSPVKHIEIALEAIKILVQSGLQVSFSVIGDVPSIDNDYFEDLKKKVEVNNLSKIVSFKSGVTQQELPDIYGGFEICLNLTEEGSFDKTIVEATSCGAIPLVSSSSFSSLLPEVCITDNIPENIAKNIKALLEPESQIRIKKDLEKFVQAQSLAGLILKLKTEIE